MEKKQTLPIPAAGKPQLIAFSLHADKAGVVIPWLNVDGEWVQQADLAVGAPIAISVENDLLTIKAVADGGTGN
jgi:hypothetical protein